MLRTSCLLIATLLLPTAVFAEAIEAGPIWSQRHAESVCPAIAASHGAQWTGRWWTTRLGRMSVCEVGVDLPTQIVNAGLIRDQREAETICRAIAVSHGGNWTGQWWTTVEGEMSVCELR